MRYELTIAIMKQSPFYGTSLRIAFIINIIKGRYSYSIMSNAPSREVLNQVDIIDVIKNSQNKQLQRIWGLFHGVETAAKTVVKDTDSQRKFNRMFTDLCKVAVLSLSEVEDAVYEITNPGMLACNAGVDDIMEIGERELIHSIAKHVSIGSRLGAQYMENVGMNAVKVNLRRRKERAPQKGKKTHSKQSPDSKPVGSLSDFPGASDLMRAGGLDPSVHFVGISENDAVAFGIADSSEVMGRHLSQEDILLSSVQELKHLLQPWSISAPDTGFVPRCMSTRSGPGGDGCRKTQRDQLAFLGGGLGGPEEHKAPPPIMRICLTEDPGLFLQQWEAREAAYATLLSFPCASLGGGGSRGSTSVSSRKRARTSPSVLPRGAEPPSTAVVSESGNVGNHAADTHSAVSAAEHSPIVAHVSASPNPTADVTSGATTTNAATVGALEPQTFFPDLNIIYTAEVTPALLRERKFIDVSSPRWCSETFNGGLFVPPAKFFRVKQPQVTERRRDRRTKNYKSHNELFQQMRDTCISLCQLLSSFLSDRTDCEISKLAYSRVASVTPDATSPQYEIAVNAQDVVRFLASYCLSSEPAPWSLHGRTSTLEQHQWQRRRQEQVFLARRVGYFLGVHARTVGGANATAAGRLGNFIAWTTMDAYRQLVERVEEAHRQQQRAGETGSRRNPVRPGTTLDAPPSLSNIHHPSYLRKVRYLIDSLQKDDVCHEMQHFYTHLGPEQKKKVEDGETREQKDLQKTIPHGVNMPPPSNALCRVCGKRAWWTLCEGARRGSPPLMDKATTVRQRDHHDHPFWDLFHTHLLPLLEVESHGVSGVLPEKKLVIPPDKSVLEHAVKQVFPHHEEAVGHAAVMAGAAAVTEVYPGLTQLANWTTRQWKIGQAIGYSSPCSSSKWLEAVVQECLTCAEGMMEVMPWCVEQAEVLSQSESYDPEGGAELVLPSACGQWNSWPTNFSITHHAYRYTLCHPARRMIIFPAGLLIGAVEISGEWREPPRRGNYPSSEEMCPPSTLLILPTSARRRLTLAEEDLVHPETGTEDAEGNRCDRCVVSLSQSEATKCQVDTLVLMESVPDHLEGVLHRLRGEGPGLVLLLVQGDVPKPVWRRIRELWGEKQEERGLEKEDDEAARTLIVVSQVGARGIQQLAGRFKTVPNLSCTTPEHLRLVQFGLNGRTRQRAEPQMSHHTIAAREDPISGLGPRLRSHPPGSFRIGIRLYTLDHAEGERRGFLQRHTRHAVVVSVLEAGSGSPATVHQNAKKGKERGDHQDVACRASLRSDDDTQTSLPVSGYPPEKEEQGKKEHAGPTMTTSTSRGGHHADPAIFPTPPHNSMWLRETSSSTSSSSSSSSENESSSTGLFFRAAPGGVSGSAPVQLPPVYAVTVGSVATGTEAGGPAINTPLTSPAKSLQMAEAPRGAPAASVAGMRFREEEGAPRSPVEDPELLCYHCDDEEGYPDTSELPFSLLPRCTVLMSQPTPLLLRQALQHFHLARRWLVLSLVLPGPLRRMVDRRKAQVAVMEKLWEMQRPRECQQEHDRNREPDDRGSPGCAPPHNLVRPLWQQGRVEAEMETPPVEDGFPEALSSSVFDETYLASVLLASLRQLQTHCADHDQWSTAERNEVEGAAPEEDPHYCCTVNSCRCSRYWDAAAAAAAFGSDTISIWELKSAYATVVRCLDDLCSTVLLYSDAATSSNGAGPEVDREGKKPDAPPPFIFIFSLSCCVFFLVHHLPERTVTKGQRNTHPVRCRSRCRSYELSCALFVMLPICTVFSTATHPTVAYVEETDTNSTRTFFTQKNTENKEGTFGQKLLNRVIIHEEEEVELLLVILLLLLLAYFSSWDTDNIKKTSILEEERDEHSFFAISISISYYCRSIISYYLLSYIEESGTDLERLVREEEASLHFCSLHSQWAVSSKEEKDWEKTQRRRKKRKRKTDTIPRERRKGEGEGKQEQQKTVSDITVGPVNPHTTTTTIVFIFPCGDLSSHLPPLHPINFYFYPTKNIYI
eukprot:gene3794-2684_t